MGKTHRPGKVIHVRFQDGFIREESPQERHMRFARNLGHLLGLGMALFLPPLFFMIGIAGLIWLVLR